MDIKKLITALLVSLSTILTFSCNQAEQQLETKESELPSSASEETPLLPKSNKYIVMILSHQVKNHDKWRADFLKDENLTTLESAGLEVNGIYRDFSDTKHVSVMMKVENPVAAKKYTETVEFKSSLSNSGVIGDPEARFYELMYLHAFADLNFENRAFLMQKVQDYEKWITAFENQDTARLARGITTVIIARNLDDTDEVAIAATATDMTTLKNYFSNSEMIAAIKESTDEIKPKLIFAKKTFPLPYEKYEPGKLAPTDIDATGKKIPPPAVIE